MELQLCGPQKAQLTERFIAQVTHFSNKTGGNISDLEDVIDRILSFVVCLMPRRLIGVLVGNEGWY